GPASPQSSATPAQAAPNAPPSTLPSGQPTSHGDQSSLVISAPLRVEGNASLHETAPSASGVASIVEDESEYEDEEDEEDDDEEASGRRGATRVEYLADRGWFGEEVWGASARHRSAAGDPAKLGRFALPPLASERDLAAWLNVPLTRLRWYTHDRPADTV